MKTSTQEKIIQGALTVLATNPLASLDEIADAAGVGRATLYRHFESRQVLMQALLINAGQQMDEVVDPILAGNQSAKQRLVQMVHSVVPLGASLKIAVFDPFCKFLPEYQVRIEEIERKVRRFCQELKYEGVVAPELSDAWITATLKKLILTAWESIQSGDIALNDAPELVLRTFLTGNRPLDYGRLPDTEPN